MTTTNTTVLKDVLDNVKKNRDAIAAQLIASTKALGTPSPEVVAAIDLLCETYQSNVQLIGHAIGAKLQIEQLDKTADEVNTLVAALEIALATENIDARLQQQVSADFLRNLSAPAQLQPINVSPPTGDMV